MELKGLKSNFRLMVKKLEHISDKVIALEAPNLFRIIYEFLITEPSLHIKINVLFQCKLNWKTNSVDVGQLL